MIAPSGRTAATNPLLPDWPELIIGAIAFVIIFFALLARS